MIEKRVQSNPFEDSDVARYVRWADAPSRLVVTLASVSCYICCVDAPSVLSLSLLELTANESVNCAVFRSPLCAHLVASPFSRLLHLPSRSGHRQKGSDDEESEESDDAGDDDDSDFKP